LPLVVLLVLHVYGDLRYLHSFPTRRSSDLQLARVERLGDVIVGAHLQPHDAVDVVAPAGDEDDADAGPRPELAGEREAVLAGQRSEEHTSELQSRENLVCRLLLEKKKRTET